MLHFGASSRSRTAFLLVPAALSLALSLPAFASPYKKGPAPKYYAFKLSHAPLATPHPGPSVVLYLPKSYKKTGKLNLIVHFHGLWNCVSATVEGKNGSCGGRAAQGHNLIAQVEAARVNAAFVAIEVAYSSSSTSAGKLSEEGYFSDLIDELIGKIGGYAGRRYSRYDLGRVYLTSHSSYWPTAEVLAYGNVPISGVLLFDSFYPNKNKRGPKDDACYKRYLDWVYANAHGKLMVVYTNGGGTKSTSQTLARDVIAAYGVGNVYHERHLKDSQAMSSAGLRKPFVFVNSGYNHDDSVRKWYAAFLRNSGL